MNVLITGGAGFIGTHLAKRLLSEGCAVRILDNLSPQIHGDTPRLDPALEGHVEMVVGAVQDRAALETALAGQDAVVHLAAETGTGQSMYEVARYEDVNIKGTALLMDCLVNGPDRSVGKVVVASSRALYGEGKYECPTHGVVFPAQRAAEDMKNGLFEPRCPECGAFCAPLPTDESAPFRPASFYGLTKQVQEQMTLLFAETLGLSAFALRYQNVYGPGQSLQNPYTGVLAVFSNQARAGKPIYIFEDGAETRDFVYIADVVEATWRCLRPETTGIAALNVGSGRRTSIAEVVREIVAFFGSDSEVATTGAFRLGDIRHNVADLTRAAQTLGYAPRWDFRDGIREFLSWAQAGEPGADRYEDSLREMQRRGLMHG